MCHPERSEGSPPLRGGILTCTCVHVQVSVAEFSLTGEAVPKGFLRMTC
jgi:hypothetical protein